MASAPQELHEFLIEPVTAASGLRGTVRGVRYPDGRAAPRLRAPASRYGGWIANVEVPRLRRAPGDGACAAAALCRRRCPASPRSACSRRWPAASRWSARPGDDEEGLFRAGQDFLSARDGERDDGAARRGAAAIRRWRGRCREPGWRRSAAGTPARIGSTNCSRSSPAVGAARLAPTDRRRQRNEDRLLRFEPAVVLLERRRHLLSRPAAGAGARSATTSPSTSPTSSTGSAIATSRRPIGAASWSIQRTDDGLRAPLAPKPRTPMWWSRRAASASPTIALLAAVLDAARPDALAAGLGRRCAGDAGRDRARTADHPLRRRACRSSTWC